MKNTETLLKDFEWVLKVLRTCENEKQVEGAIRCYFLWIRKYRNFNDYNELLFIKSLQTKFLEELALKKGKVSLDPYTVS